MKGVVLLGRDVMSSTLEPRAAGCNMTVVNSGGSPATEGACQAGGTRYDVRRKSDSDGWREVGMKARTRHLVLCMLAVVALVNASWAGDAWKDKKPADWSEKDMHKFMTNSPWSRTVQPSMAQMSTDRGPTSANTGGWGGGPGGGGGGGGQWGGGGGMGNATPIMTLEVRWVSAPIMREALKMSESEPFNAAVERYAKDYYIVSVTMQVAGASSGGGPRGRGGWGGGAPSGGGGGQWGAPGAGQAPSKEQEEARKRFQETLIRGATLTVDGKAVHPERAEMTPSKTGMATLYLFPRTLKLEDMEKDYVFEVSQGPSVTRANFSFKGFEQAPEKGM